MILDRPLYLWNKDNKKHLYIEVDSCDEGWGSCTYQYMQKTIPSMPKLAKLTCLAKILRGLFIGYPKLGHLTRSKVFRFYKETIGRLLTLEQNRNLIETQEVGHGVTCYSDIWKTKVKIRIHEPKTRFFDLKKNFIARIRIWLTCK